MACYKAWETGYRYAAPLSLADNASSPSVGAPFAMGGHSKSARRAPGCRGRASLLRAAGIGVHSLPHTRPQADVSSGPARYRFTAFYFYAGLFSAARRGRHRRRAGPASSAPPAVRPRRRLVRRRLHPSPPRSSFLNEFSALPQRPACCRGRRVSVGLRAACARWARGPSPTTTSFLPAAYRRHPHFISPECGGGDHIAVTAGGAGGTAPGVLSTRPDYGPHLSLGRPLGGGRRHENLLRLKALSRTAPPPLVSEKARQVVESPLSVGSPPRSRLDWTPIGDDLWG